jgi:Na+-driven multidrug efflux pump
MLVSAAYNITDQIFIGHIIGIYGNAATNVAFPLSQLLTGLANLIGVGTATNFNLSMGADKQDEAKSFAGCGIALMIIAGVSIATLGRIFIGPLLNAFGATPQVYPLARQYLGITLIGMPFLLFNTSFSNLIRADGAPSFSMFSTIFGAVVNIFLDALLMITFDMGIAGAALATIIGQFLSFLLTLYYVFRKFKSVKLEFKIVRVNKKATRIFALGTAAFCNHFVMMLVQITMNNTLRYYGGLSAYGSEIPLAVVGVVTKVNTVVIAFTVGTSQGCQPIFGFNYGAKNYTRVQETFMKAIAFITSMCTVFFLIFQLFPRQIVSIFGSGDALYFEFATKYMRIFMMMMFINGVQPITINFFNSMGKAKQGIFISLTSQGLYLIQLLLIFPIFFGIDGAINAGPVAEVMAVLTCVVMANREIKQLKALEAAKAI